MKMLFKIHAEFSWASLFAHRAHSDAGTDERVYILSVHLCVLFDENGDEPPPIARIYICHSASLLAIRAHSKALSPARCRIMNCKSQFVFVHAHTGGEQAPHCANKPNLISPPPGVIIIKVGDGDKTETIWDWFTTRVRKYNNAIGDRAGTSLTTISESHAETFLH